ncbi:PREDICTED: myomegalin-like, partial [Galeopterus variegatus]|uniref:Myomegalin-like n=1 Tax=Galeopterus variegatus TaxID=482537 RepID=A0ABM0Q495_GALVR
ELQELLKYRDNSDKTLEANEMLLEKLRQRIQDKAIALEAAAEKMVHSLMERNSELQALRQYLGGKDFMMSQAHISNQQAEVTSNSPPLGEQTDQSSIQIPSRDGSTSLTAKEDASIPRSTLGDLDTVAGLEKELSNAKEELELMAKKERESQ